MRIDKHKNRGRFAIRKAHQAKTDKMKYKHVPDPNNTNRRTNHNSKYCSGSKVGQ